jgi:rhodanese-related sulfurtransferase
MRIKCFRKTNFILILFTLISTFFYIPIPIVIAQSYNNISVETAHNMISNKTQFPNLVILDVREQWEYNESHLCNSTLIPLSEINTRIDELEPYKQTEIIVYCRSGSRSAQASQNLADNYNFTKIYNMLGGIGAWISAGYEVCNGQVQPVIPFPGLLFLSNLIAVSATLALFACKKNKFGKKKSNIFII